VGRPPVCRALMPALIVSLASGCRTDQSRIDEIAHDYIRLAVALAERDPDSRDYYYGQANWVSDVRDHPPAAAEIQKQAQACIRRLDALPATPRTSFLSGQLRAIAARVDLLKGKHPPFDDEARALFGLAPYPPHDREKANRVRAQINRLLPGPGTLAKRYAQFDRDFLIPDDVLDQVLERSIEGCRQRALAHVSLPQGESVTVQYVRNKPWDGYSYYQGAFHSVIQVNADFPLTVDRALQLACHEGYPGHHAFNSLAEEKHVRHEHQLEWMVEPTFSPQSLVSEALATNAADLAFSPQDRLAFERDVLFPVAHLDPQSAEKYLQVSRLIGDLDIAQPDIARAYLNGNLEYERAAEALEEQVLMENADATLKYVNEYRTYMLAYTQGKEMARVCFARALDRWDVFKQLIAGTERLIDCAN
jgi:hypothetical protein